MATKSNASTQAASMLKIQGIVAIVFGGLGILLSFVLLAIFALALSATYNDTEMIELVIYFFATLIFLLVPSIFLIISGIFLTRQPEPRLARILTIANLIVGAMSNYVVLAFAIISLTQSKDYEDGYAVSK